MNFNLRDESVFAATGHRALEPEQPYVLFIHGAGMDHTVWQPYERYFAARGFNVLSIDLPGHGRSSGAPLNSIELMAEWVGDVLQHVEARDAILVGHSMGSLVAFECAARHRRRITKAILLGFSSPMAVGAPLLEAARNNDASAIDMMVIFGHDFHSQLGGNRNAGVHVINSAKRLLERNAPGVLFNDLNACNEYRNGEHAAAEITCPMVFITGDRDKMTPPKAALEMSRNVSSGTMQTVQNSGHGVMAEQPELTHNLLVAALA